MILQSHSWAYIWERLKTLIQKVACTPLFTAALFTTTAKSRKQRKYTATVEWIKKTWYIYTMEYYSGFKKKEIIHLQQHG